ncbi:MAG: DUF2167 domain-containing protein [Thermoguttaceae bacterium]|jgi:uncharacterized membrane-anchored protein
MHCLTSASIRTHSLRGRAAPLAATLLAAGLALCVVSAYAQNDPKQTPNKAEHERILRLVQSIRWQKGPSVGKLGDVAEIKIPEGYELTDRAGAAAWAELTQNVENPNDLGVLRPTSQGEWFLIFMYDDSGHVPDAEKTQLDAEAILASLKAGNDEANKIRHSKGWAELSIVGWIHPPAYEDATHHLVWAIRGSSGGEDIANYNTRILGRTGVMSANLVVEPREMEQVVPTVQTLLTGFDFSSGHKYSEWRSGDKLAAYGLTGLITGGAAVAAAKTGLLAKLGLVIAKAGKAIVIGILALAAGLWKLFARIFRGNRAAE